MSAPDRHFKEEIHDLLDGRLDAAARLEVELHLETCEECRRVFDAVHWTKNFTASYFAAPPEAPAELRDRILGALRAEAAPANIITPPPSRWRPRTILALASAAVLMLSAILAFVHFTRKPQMPALMAELHRDYLAQRLTLEFKTSDVKEMESYFASHGVAFQTRVFDLGMMNYQLVGGRVERGRPQPAALFVYRGPDDRMLLCEMFAGKMADLPAGAEVREHNGFRFQIYRDGDRTAVFWPEGAILCVLVSDGPPEEVIQLAFAKAMAPPH
jgi:anti-sigma factor RsiW